MKIIYVLIFLFFSACSSNPPEWYNKIYTDNQNFIYATGEGKTKEEAINSALANASAKIAIVVKSLYKSKKYSYKGDDTSAYSNISIFDIQTKTNPITFTNYKILKIDKKDKYYVLLKINRYKNAKYMCNNIEMDNINDENLNLFFNYKTIIKKLNNKIQKLKSINAIYPICKQKLQNAISLKNKIEKKYNNLTFNIYSNDSQIKDIISSILKIQSSKRGNIKIYSISKTTYKQIGNYKIAIINLNINIKSQNKSKNIAIKCAGSSIQDFHTAKELAYEQCKEKLKEFFNH